MASRARPCAPYTLSLALMCKSHPLAYVVRADVLIVVSLDTAPTSRCTPVSHHPRHVPLIVPSLVLICVWRTSILDVLPWPAKTTLMHRHCLALSHFLGLPLAARRIDDCAPGGRLSTGGGPWLFPHDSLMSLLMSTSEKHDESSIYHIARRSAPASHRSQNLRHTPPRRACAQPGHRCRVRFRRAPSRTFLLA